MENKMLGAWSEMQEATAEIQGKCNKLKPEIEPRLNKTFEVFRAVQYFHQTVAGTNYLVLIDVGNVSVLDVTFFEDLPCNGGQLTLTGVKEISLLKAF